MSYSDGIRRRHDLRCVGRPGIIDELSQHPIGCIVRVRNRLGEEGGGEAPAFVTIGMP